jgi:hypothetical protein
MNLIFNIFIFIQYHIIEFLSFGVCTCVTNYTFGILFRSRDSVT